MSDSTPRGEWPEALEPYRLDGSAVVEAKCRRDTRPGRDSLGTPGREERTTALATQAVHKPRAEVVGELEQAGLTNVRTTAEEVVLSRRRNEDGDLLGDPFLLEDSVRATVLGRDFPGRQREVVQKKVETLAREADSPTTAEIRRGKIRAMLDDLRAGLESRVELRSVVRRFRPEVEVEEPVEAMGRIVPVRAGTRIVYRVNSVDQEAGQEGEAEPMVFHVLAVGRAEAVMLFTGGVHGMRHLRRLDDSPVHHAWFANREKARTECTAPWIGRAVFRELKDYGSSEIVIRRGRDEEPIAVEKIGEDTAFVRVDGRPLSVPVIRCRTSAEDDLVILDDPESPLVLRLDEKGAEIIRTIDDVLSAPDHAFEFPGDAELAAITAEIDLRFDAALGESDQE